MRSTGLLSALLAIALVPGCGVKKDTHRKALDTIKTLEGQLADKDKEVVDRDARIRLLEENLARLGADIDQINTGKALTEEELEKVRQQKEATELELAELRIQRDAAEKRLAAYRDLQKRFKSLVETGALEIAFRNGQMTLKLPSGVLFTSGSADLSVEGKNTLTQVTEALMAFADRRFLIAGHTDNVPIKTKKFKNNWYLSTARAVSVLEYMITAGFPATGLAAAGYGEMDPVDTGTTEEARSLNRRIEIILVPDLSELPQLSEEPTE